MHRASCVGRSAAPWAVLGAVVLSGCTAADKSVSREHDRGFAPPPPPKELQPASTTQSFAIASYELTPGTATISTTSTQSGFLLRSFTTDASSAKSYDVFFGRPLGASREAELGFEEVHNSILNQRVRVPRLLSGFGVFRGLNPILVTRAVVGSEGTELVAWTRTDTTPPEDWVFVEKIEAGKHVYIWPIGGRHDNASAIELESGQYARVTNPASPITGAKIGLIDELKERHPDVWAFLVDARLRGQALLSPLDK